MCGHCFITPGINLAMYRRFNICKIARNAQHITNRYNVMLQNECWILRGIVLLSIE